MGRSPQEEERWKKNTIRPSTVRQAHYSGRTALNVGRSQSCLLKDREFAKIALRLYNAFKNEEVAHETGYYLPRRRRLLGRRMPKPSGLHKSGQDKRRGRGKHKRSHRALHRRT